MIMEFRPYPTGNTCASSQLLEWCTKRNLWPFFSSQPKSDVQKFNEPHHFHHKPLHLCRNLTSLTFIVNLCTYAAQGGFCHHLYNLLRWKPTLFHFNMYMYIIMYQRFAVLSPFSDSLWKRYLLRRWREPWRWHFCNFCKKERRQICQTTVQSMMLIPHPVSLSSTSWEANVERCRMCLGWNLLYPHLIGFASLPPSLWLSLCPSASRPYFRKLLGVVWVTVSQSVPLLLLPLCGLQHPMLRPRPSPSPSLHLFPWFVPL